MNNVKKKMILFSYSSIPSFTANSIAVMNFCHELNKICDLTVVCIKNKKIKDNYQSFYNIDKIKLILLPAYFLRFHYFFYKIYSVLLCLFKRPDIIFSRDIVISYTLTNLGFNNIFEIHQIKQNGNNYYTNNFENMLHKMKDKESLNYVVAISDSLKKDCIKFGIPPKKIVVLNSGVRKDFFEANIKNNRDILYLGSLQKGKGIQNIINLSKKLKDYKFVILGGKKEELTNLPTNLVHKSWVKPSSVLDYIKDITYAVILFDTQDYKFYSPLKLFEYMAMGKIIIASDIEGINDVIIDKYNGFLVDPSNTEMICNIIKTLEKNYDMKSKISNNAKRTAKQYTWEKRAHKIINMKVSDRDDR